MVLLTFAPTHSLFFFKVLRKEKIEIEMVMEKEQEAMVNKLLRERDAALAEIKQLRNLRHSSVTSPRSSSTIRSPSSHSSTPPNLNSASALAGAAAVSFDSATLGEASSGNVISEQDSAPKGDESLSSPSGNSLLYFSCMTPLHSSPRETDRNTSLHVT